MLGAWGGEEQGLVGSRAYAQKCKANDVDIIAMIQVRLISVRFTLCCDRRNAFAACEMRVEKGCFALLFVCVILTLFIIMLTRVHTLCVHAHARTG